jgi:hypothetical protein
MCSSVTVVSVVVAVERTKKKEELEFPLLDKRVILSEFLTWVTVYIAKVTA